MHQLSMHSPFGDLTIFADGEAIIALDWGWTPDQMPNTVLRETKRQLDAYFDGELERFELTLAPDGTDFQRSVWARMSKIPYSETMTYGEMAVELATMPQPIGGACGANPIPIIIPCHRVLATGGNMGGYSGEGGIETKKALLVLEGNLPFKQDDLFTYI